MLMSAYFGAGLIALLAIAAVIDARTQRIPDPLNAAIALLGAAFVWATGQDALQAALGAAFGFGAIWGVNALYLRLRGRDGIGMGDAKLMGAGGLWIGLLGAPFAMILGTCAALAGVALMRLRGRAITGTDRLAFGPYLAFGVGAVFAVLQLLAVPAA